MNKDHQREKFSIEIDDPAITEEIEYFIKERQKIRKVLDGIDKTKQGPLSKVMDIGFIVGLVILAMARFAFNWIDNILSLELGLILLSIKIVWLIKVQNTYNHFIFMIMHTLDHHQNEMAEKLERIENILITVDRK